MTARISKVNLEIKYINLMIEENKSEWYTKINPKQKIPALKLDDGTVFTESIEICKYFCNQAGGNYLYPCECMQDPFFRRCLFCRTFV